MESERKDRERDSGWHSNTEHATMAAAALVSEPVTATPWPPAGWLMPEVGAGWPPEETLMWLSEWVPDVVERIAGSHSAPI